MIHKDLIPVEQEDRCRFYVDLTAYAQPGVYSPTAKVKPIADAIQQNLDESLILPVNRDADASTTPGFLPLDSGG